MKRILVTFLLLVVATSTAYGSLYLWNPNKRVPVTLQKALSIAEKLLGDDAKSRYCISVMLYGNKAQDGKECGWNMVFAAEDGSEKMVFVDETGKGGVQKWNSAINWREKPQPRNGLADIAKRMNAALAARGYEERAKVVGNKLSLIARSRSFRIHKRIGNGEYSTELIEVTGPEKDGIVVEAVLTDRIEQEWQPMFGPYWVVHQGTYRLTGDQRFVRVLVKHGNDNSFISHRDQDIVLPILQCLGELASQRYF